MARWLAGHTVAVSISESEDLGRLGLEPDHVREVLERITQQVLALGATLAYGGDLRQGGFTWDLVNYANRYNVEGETSIVHYFAWPFYEDCTSEEIQDFRKLLQGFGRQVLLGPRGEELNPEDLSKRRWRRTAKLHAQALSAMRKRMNDDCQVRVVLGGRRTGYLGVMPGVAEEALLAWDAFKPLLVLGGFGGVASDIAGSLGLYEGDWAQPEGSHKAYRQVLAHFNEGSARFRKSIPVPQSDLETLARTHDVQECVALTLRAFKAVSRSTDAEADTPQA